jgi:hypothetical protein
MPRLTPKLFNSLCPDENRDRIVFDETVPGFGVRVFRSGRKSFVIQYRSQKRSRRYTLGNCNVLTSLQARRKAQSLLAGREGRRRPRAGTPRKPSGAYRRGSRGTLLARPLGEKEDRR